MRNETKTEGVVKNKKFFYIALVSLIFTVALLLPFPHRIPYSEAILLSFITSPVVAEQFGGILRLVLLVGGLCFLSMSLNKYKGRITLLALIITLSLPSFLVGTYQKTIATGIYAISYEKDMSKCNFETINPDKLRSICEFTFENHSNNDVPFEITFYDQYLFDDNGPKLSSMNSNVPYQVLLKEKERKSITIETDLAKKKNYIDGGQAGSINIMIWQGEKKREL